MRSMPLNLNERRFFNATILPSVWRKALVCDDRVPRLAVDKGGRCCSGKQRLRWSFSKLILPSQNISSQYVGVKFCKAASKWMSQLSIQSRQTHLGCYKQEAAAAKARDK